MDRSRRRGARIARDPFARRRSRASIEGDKANGEHEAEEHPADQQGA
jgi:hypothetical protein